MAKNIEEFLKMAAERRQQGQQTQQQQDIVEIVDEVQIVEPLRNSSVGSHVQSHIDTSDISEHARQLGERVAAADSNLERRLHSKFDHSVGSFREDRIRDRGEVSAHSTRAYEAEDAPEKALEIINMLRSPSNVRNAILLNEILKRPDFDD